MTKQTKRRRSKKRRPDFFQKNRFLLLLIGVAGFAVISLVLLARMEETPSVTELPPIKELPPIITPLVDYTEKIHAEVETLLSKLSLGGGEIQRDLKGEPARYKIESDFPSYAQITDFQARLTQFPGDYAVSLSEQNTLVIEKNRKPQIVILFTPPVPDIPAGPLLAIIMDDLGRSTYTAEMLLSISEKVTFAILPDEPHAAQVAELAYAADREIMLHAPMEPQGYPAVNPGVNALFVGDSDAQIRRRFDKFLSKVPHVSGSNNHMGSRFTEDARALSAVMESLQEKGMFFIDSRTTGHSRVTEVAVQYGVPTMDRDVFLDNVAEVDAVIREIRRLEAKARRKGMAIGICHPYPETLEALRRELPGLAARGVTVVPVSVLLQRQALSQGH